MKRNKFYTFNNFILILLIVFNVVERTKTQCDWKCDNGECLDIDNLCDGEVHCRDGSDESAENCIHMDCQTFSFRCAYGACVAGSEKCNGIKKCSDNSDENPFLCETDTTSLNEKLRGSCSISQMECAPGKCIEGENKCDGKRHCENGSDETVEVCSGLLCPSYAFRCGYGGCVNGNAKCNGTKECADGSDEAAVLCGYSRKQGGSANANKPTRPINRPTPGPTQKPTNKPTSGGGCRIPTDRNNLIFKNENDQTFLQPGDVIPYSFIVSFKCNPGNTLDGVIQTLCSESNWPRDIPKCTSIEYCDPTILEAGVSTTATCMYKGKQVSCTNILPGTEAQIKCAYGFEKFNWLVQPDDKILCNENGKWSNYNKIRCAMQCGTVQPWTTEFIKEGVDVDVNETPWYTTIYSQFKVGSYNRICGGSIISPHLILSAAHCFWDKVSLAPFDASFYEVLAGKLLADYTISNDVVQKRNISKIIINDYKGEENQYQNDLSLLVLSQHFTFSVAIRPICLEFKSNANRIIDSNIAGFIVGFGINKQRNEVLQKLDMNSLSYFDCVNDLRNKNANYRLQDDKFCLKNTAGGSACRGDSGGGFVVQSIFNEVTYHRLLGIISHTPAKMQDCSRDGLVTLTNINFFDELINKYYKDDVADKFYNINL